MGGAGAGRFAFAVVLIALGVQGVVQRVFTAVWAPVPAELAGHEALAVFCATVSLGAGLGLLRRRTGAAAAGALLALLIVWWLAFRAPVIARAPAALLPWDGGAETAVIVAAAWTLFAQLSARQGTRRPAFATGERGVRIARTLFGLAQLPFGLAHFVYVGPTASLVPRWLPAHVPVAYGTGAAFLAGGLAVLTGVVPRLAATLTALQVGLFTLLVWVPIVASGHADAFAWSEFALSCAITAGGWVVADSYERRRR